MYLPGLTFQESYSNLAVQQVRLAAKETHDSLQHFIQRETSKTTLSEVLCSFPLCGLLNAAMHFCCVPDTPATGIPLNQQEMHMFSCKLQPCLLLQIKDRALISCALCNAVSIAQCRHNCHLECKRVSLRRLTQRHHSVSTFLSHVAQCVLFHCYIMSCVYNHCLAVLCHMMQQVGHTM